MKLIWIFELQDTRSSICASRTWLRAWCQQPKSWVVGLLGRTAKFVSILSFFRHQEEKERKTKTPVSIHAPRRWCDRVVCGNGEGRVGTWRKRVAAAMATAATGGTHTNVTGNCFNGIARGGARELLCKSATVCLCVSECIRSVRLVISRIFF